MEWFRGGLVFKAERLLHYSIVGSRVMKKKKKKFLVTPTIGRHWNWSCRKALLFLLHHIQGPKGFDSRETGFDAGEKRFDAEQEIFDARGKVLMLDNKNLMREKMGSMLEKKHFRISSTVRPWWELEEGCDT